MSNPDFTRFDLGHRHGTHGETKFFCTRNAETPHNFHRKWWCAQSSSTSSSAIHCCFQGDANCGVPSPWRLMLHGLWVSAVTTSGSVCLIWSRDGLMEVYIADTFGYRVAYRLKTRIKILFILIYKIYTYAIYSFQPSALAHVLPTLVFLKKVSSCFHF